MSLRAENRRIEISGEDAVEVFRVIELVLISLHRIGAQYAVSEGEPMDTRGYEHETTRFIDEWHVTSRLVEARRLLGDCFDRTRGDDDMDDLERAVQTIGYWSNPGSTASGTG
jgi:hypothetical protein